MPYQRRYAYRRRNYAKKRTVSKPVKSYIRRQIVAAERKESPLIWVDLKFTGDSVSTTPNAYSLLKKFVLDGVLPVLDSLPPSYVDGDLVRKADLTIESFTYQLRYQNDTTDLYSTARFLAYATSNDLNSASTIRPILDGADVDSPPETSTLLNMYFDKLRYVRDLQADEDSEAPGTAIMKGNVRVGRKFKFDYLTDDNTWQIDNNDIIFEMQSNSGTAPHPSLYGFIRIYGRVMY